MRAYFEGPQDIRILVDKWFYEGKTGDFKLYPEGGGRIALHVEHVREEGELFIYTAKSDIPLEIMRAHVLYERYGSHCRVFAGGEYVRSEEFDRQFSYDGDDLGPVYTPEATVFKLWAPLARRVILLNHRDDAAEIMKREDRGVWSCRIDGDCDGLEYTYWVDNGDQMQEAPDPYAVSSTPNGVRSVVIDKNKLAFRPDKTHVPPVSGMHELITYELSVRDYTFQQGRSTFRAMTEHFDYIEKLGITNLQLLPVYDFATVNENDKFAHYNWGYDPHNYNVLDGSFAENPHDPYERLNSFGQLIHHANQRGIRVSMDVVYNHLYDAIGSIYNRLVPGYFIRHNADGSMSNGSFCGNDFRSEGAMVRKFIVDSVLHFARTFGVDGFRFDLMGDLDIETMNQVKQALGPGVLVYGEGWNMPSALPEHTRACIENQAHLPGIGHFNDRFRNAFKGEGPDSEKIGLLLGRSAPTPHLTDLLLGSAHVFSDLSKSINYVECHDNHTFFDWVTHVHGVKDPEEAREICTLAMASVLLSFGVPFLHAGQEFLRTKQGVENSYNADDQINQFDWGRIKAGEATVAFARHLIQFRKSKPQYRLHSAELAGQVAVRELAPNVVEIQGENLRVLFNFSAEDYPLDSVGAALQSNKPVKPGMLRRHQVCFE